MSSFTVSRTLNVWYRALFGAGIWDFLLWTGLCWIGLSPSYAQDLPVFDAHIHYSQPDWAVLTPDQVLAILDRAGVRRALVSSTPDDGTLRLYDKAPQRIVPFLRPYRSREDMLTWHSDPAVQTYVEERLTRGVYKGIGEFHLLTADQADAPVVKRCAELAAQRQIFLHAHVDDATVEKLLQLYPQVKILWAHAGMSASAATVSSLLDRFPTPLGGVGHAHGCGPPRHARPRVASSFLASSGALHGRHRHVGDVALGDTGGGYAGHPPLARRTSSRGRRADRPPERRTPLYKSIGVFPRLVHRQDIWYFLLSNNQQ